MREVPSAASELADKLLHLEPTRDLDGVELAMDAHRVLIRLEERLSKLFGHSGYSALLGRAVHLAQRDFGSLDQLVVDNDTQGGLRGLEEFGASGADDPRATAAALSSILANFIWLLVVFIGVELSARLIAELWPELAASARELSEQEGRPHS